MACHFKTLISWTGHFWVKWSLRNSVRARVDLCFPCGSAGKESACHVGELGSIPGLGRSPGEGKGYLLQYSGLENPMDCIVHGVTKIWTRLSEFHFQGWIHTVSSCPHLLCPVQFHRLFLRCFGLSRWALLWTKALSSRCSRHILRWHASVILCHKQDNRLITG